MSLIFKNNLIIDKKGHAIAQIVNEGYYAGSLVIFLGDKRYKTNIVNHSHHSVVSMIGDDASFIAEDHFSNKIIINRLDSRNNRLSDAELYTLNKLNSSYLLKIQDYEYIFERSIIFRKKIVFWEFVTTITGPEENDLIAEIIFCILIIYFSKC